MTKSELQALIQGQINKYNNDAAYYGSFEAEKNEYFLLAALKDDFGFDYEGDSVLAGNVREYCLKATPVEIWQYYLDNVLPTL
jgi:hypothetical protein